MPHTCLTQAHIWHSTHNHTTNMHTQTHTHIYTQNHIHIQSHTHTQTHMSYTHVSLSHTQKHTCHMAHVEDSLQGLVFSFLLTSRNWNQFFKFGSEYACWQLKLIFKWQNKLINALSWKSPNEAFCVDIALYLSSPHLWVKSIFSQNLFGSFFSSSCLTYGCKKSFPLQRNLIPFIRALKLSY